MNLTGLRGPVVKSAIKHRLSRRCGSSLARGIYEMPSFATVGQVFFLRVPGFRPSLINDRLDISEIFLKEP